MTDLLVESVVLSLEDSKRHLRYAFTCPAGVHGLHLRWHFDPPGAGELRTLITVSLEGPEGFRGAGHRHGALHEVTLGPHAATPGYLPGPVLPGRWTVTLHTHLVVGRTTGELRVVGTDDLHPEEPTRPAASPPARLPQAPPSRRG